MGIGTSSPQAKLQVLATASSNSNTALRVDQQSLSGTTVGVDVKNNDPSTGHNSGTGYGVRSIVRNAATMNGVRGEAHVTATEGASEVWGVFGFGQSGANTTTAKLGGIYGGATAGGSTTTELLGGRLVVQMNSGTSHNTVRGLDVKVAPQASSTSANTWGGRFESEGTSSTSATYGVESEAKGAGGSKSYGVSASGSGSSQQNYGVYATASGTTGSSTNYAMYARATGSVGTRYGIWAQAPIAGANRAGYFLGDVEVTGVGYIPGGVWTPSDADLKTDVQNLGNASDLLSQLQPKAYQYLVDEYPNASLPSGAHAGVMADELGEVLPGLVREVHLPDMLDTLGNVLHPSMTITAVNYSGLIPYLIAAFNEQQQRLDQLEQALAACCAPSDDGSLMQAPLDSEGKPKIDPALERLMRIDPNPFTDATTVRYTLERAGRVQLLVNSSDGKQLQVLHEGNTSAGDHSYDWNTGHLAPGIYYVTLLLDGEPLVKRAVKVR